MAKTVFDVVIDTGTYVNTMATYDTYKAADLAGKDWVLDADLNALAALPKHIQKEISDRCAGDQMSDESDPLGRILSEEFGVENSYEVIEREVSDEEIAEDYLVALVKAIDLPSALSEVSWEDYARLPDGLEQDLAVDFVHQQLKERIIEELNFYIQDVLAHPSGKWFKSLNEIVK